MSLEQYLTKGSDNKVFLVKGDISDESYTLCIYFLLDSIMDQIVEGIKKSCEKITFTEATWILSFNTAERTTDYVKKQSWVLGPGNYYSFVT